MNTLQYIKDGTISFLGIFGSITLEKVNALLGIIVAILTISYWIRKHIKLSYDKKGD